MKKNRIIPVLLLRNGFLVQSRGFSRYQNVGNPIIAVRRLTEWASDELIYLDITRDDHYDMRRDDLKHPNRNNIIDIIKDVSRESYMPITVGGKIRVMEDIAIRLENGADKVAINTIALERPDFITQAAKEFGSQCIVVSIDAKIVDGKYCVMSRCGQEKTSYEPAAWAKIAQENGAGEILLNSIDRDGMKNGYDLELIKSVCDRVKIPVIACGGAGEWGHFLDVLKDTKADAVAAANIFHYIDQSVCLVKKYLYERKCNVRNPDLLKKSEEIAI